MNNFINKDGIVAPNVAFGLMLGMPLLREFEGVEYGPKTSLFEMGRLALDKPALRVSLPNAPLTVSLSSRYTTETKDYERGEVFFNSTDEVGVRVSTDISRLSPDGVLKFNRNPYNPDAICLSRFTLEGVDKVGFEECRYGRGSRLGRAVDYTLESEENVYSYYSPYKFDDFREMVLRSTVPLFTRWDGWTQDEDGLWMPPSPEAQEPADES